MRRQAVWGLGLAVMGAVIILTWPVVRPAFSGGALAMSALLASTGRFGPAVVVGLQVLQAVISPLPSWPVTVAAGALYGPMAATLLALVGGTAGAAINFGLARWLGVPLVRRVAGQVWVERAGRLGLLHFFGLSLFGRLIPVASFDVVAYVGGISQVRLLPFLGVAALGQAPAFFAYAYFGSDLAAARDAGLTGSLLMLLFAALILGGGRLWRRITAGEGRGRP